GGRRPSARQRADRLAPAGGARNARPPARRPGRRHRRRHPGRIAEQCRRRGDNQQHCRHHRDVSSPAGQGARQRHFRHSPPDPDLTRDFLRALAGTTQIKGGFHERTARAHAIPLMVERLERGLYPLPPVSDAELARRQLRPIVRTAVIADAADGEGRALARAAAEPGVRLYLIGTDPEGLARTADDCRRRGALVATGTAESAAAFDREFPVDLVVAAGGAARDAAEALAEPMRRRGRGTVVVVAAAGETPALRRRFAGVRLVVAGPGRLVRRLAAVDPRVAALGADDAAELSLRGVARGAAAVALPPALWAIRRAVRLGLRRLAGWPVRAYRRSLDEAAEAQTGALRREQGD